MPADGPADETAPDAPDDERALRRLSATYADAVDRRDVATFLSAFAADAVLEVVRPSSPAASRFAGRDELAAIPASLARWATTVHDVRGGAYVLDGAADARGEVDCHAHHVTHTEAGTLDEVMRIVYVDRYRKLPEGWRITARRVEIREVTTGPFGSAAGAGSES